MTTGHGVTYMTKEYIFNVRKYCRRRLTKVCQREKVEFVFGGNLTNIRICYE